MFRFKRFTIHQDRTAMKVGTDGVLLGAWAPGTADAPALAPKANTAEAPRILDIGTGTGVVALMMAQRFPEASITGIELDADAAQQARENVAASPWAERITVVEGDVRLWAEGSESLEGSEGSEGSENSENSEDSEGSEDSERALPQKFSAIVANPPYYAHSLPSRSAARDRARSAETLSFADLMTAAARLLAPDGTLTIVAPADATDELEAEAALRGLYIKERARVKTVERKPPKRVLLTFSPTRPATLADTTVTLQAAGGARSPWYSALTRDFYLGPEDFEGSKSSENSEKR